MSSRTQINTQWPRRAALSFGCIVSLSINLHSLTIRTIYPRQFGPVRSNCKLGTFDGSTDVDDGTVVGTKRKLVLSREKITPTL